MNQEKYICENCGNEHNGSYGSGRFCSAHCRRVWSGKHSAQGGNHKCNLPKKQRSPYGTWKCKYCGLIFETKNKLNQHQHNVHTPNVGEHNKNGKSWCNGLTKKTSDKVLKISETLKKNYSSGKLIPAFKGKHHTPKTKLLMSQKRLQNIDSGKLPGRVNIKWYDVQNINNESYRIRGHWEENVALKLNELCIYWTKCKHYIPYKLPNGIKKFYNPDFVIPSLNAFIEVKGWFDEKDKLKMYYVQKQHPDVKIYFIDKTQYMNFISKSGKLIDKLLYKNSSFYKDTDKRFLLESIYSYTEL